MTTVADNRFCNAKGCGCAVGVHGPSGCECKAHPNGCACTRTRPEFAAHAHSWVKK